MTEKVFVTRNPIELICKSVMIQAARLVANGYEGKYARQELLEFTIRCIELWTDPKNQLGLIDVCKFAVKEHDESPVINRPMPPFYTDVLIDIMQMVDFVTVDCLRGCDVKDYQSSIKNLMDDLKHRV